MDSFFTFAFIFLISGIITQGAVLTDEIQADIDAYFEKCVKQEKLSPEETTIMYNWNLNNSTMNMKCACACLLENFGALKDNKVQDEYFLRVLKPIFNEQTTKEMIGRFKDIKETDRCVIGFKIVAHILNYEYI